MEDDVFDLDLFGGFDMDDAIVIAPVETANTPEPKQPDSKQAVRSIMTRTRHLTRRVTSEAALETTLDWHLEKDCSYHVVSFGDVDSLSYLKFIVRAQPIKYAILSTWCMAMADAQLIEEWLRRGIIGRVDLYVGEIFQNQYAAVYAFVAEHIAKPFGGRVAVFRNHSKVMVGFGRDYNFAIEGSANINTNPRTEQTVITTSQAVADFYKEFYDGIHSFNRDFDDWQPFEIAE